MPKAFAIVRDVEDIGGQAHLAVDVVITDNAGKIIAKPAFNQGTLPRKSVPYTGTVAALVDAIEEVAKGLGGSVGQTLVNADVTMIAFVQGA